MCDDQARDTVFVGLKEESAPERIQARLKIAKSLSEAEFGDVLVLSHESVRKVFTPKRQEIIEVLATKEIKSVRDLADHLDRNPGNVSRELDILARHNVVGYVEEGRAKRPVLEHETIIGEPLTYSQ
jgi:predicted transcriptional regulator